MWVGKKRGSLKPNTRLGSPGSTEITQNLGTDLSSYLPRLLISSGYAAECYNHLTFTAVPVEEEMLNNYHLLILVESRKWEVVFLM